jgi:hypothetical protein
MPSKPTFSVRDYSCVGPIVATYVYITGIITEYCDGGDLSAHLDGLRERNEVLGQPQVTSLTCLAVIASKIYKLFPGCLDSRTVNAVPLKACCLTWSIRLAGSKLPCSAHYGCQLFTPPPSFASRLEYCSACQQRSDSLPGRHQDSKHLPKKQWAAQARYQTVCFDATSSL